MIPVSIGFQVQRFHTFMRDNSCSRDKMICSIFTALFIVHAAVMGMDEKVPDTANLQSSNAKPASVMLLQNVKDDGYDKYGLERPDEPFEDDLYPADDTDSDGRISNEIDDEKRARGRVPWQFAFAKRGGRPAASRFAFAKRRSSRFAFAKRRGGPSRFAFSKRDLEKRRASRFAFAKRWSGRRFAFA